MRGGPARPAGARALVAVHGRAISLLRVRTCVAAQPLGENLQRTSCACCLVAGRPAGLLVLARSISSGRRRRQCLQGKSCTWYQALVRADADAGRINRIMLRALLANLLITVLAY